MRWLFRAAALALAATTATNTTETPRALVVYAFSQHSAEAVANARYFLRFGISKDAFYVFVVNGCHSVPRRAAVNNF